MAGFDNEVLYVNGERLEPSQALSIILMQQAATDVARINYTGDPEGNVAANPSSLCHDPSSGLIYRKVSGTGNTGWEQIPDSSQTLLQVTTDSGIATVNAGNLNVISTSTNGIDTAGSGDDVTVSMATPYADGDFEFRSAVSGATRTLSVTNTSNTASSAARTNIEVAGTTASDPWLQLTVGTTTAFAIGIDNSDANDSLKFTYDASAISTPSSGTFLGAINPATGGLEWGTDANGVSNASTPIIAQKNYDGSTTIAVENSNTGTSALGGFLAANDDTFATISVPSSSFSTTACQSKLFINCDNANNDGIVYNVRSGQSHSFYAPVASNTLLATLNSTGLTLSVPLAIGTQEIFTTRQTTPSAGTLGEQFRGFAANGSVGSLSSNTFKTVTSITLTAGVWDINAVCRSTGGAITGTAFFCGIATATDSTTGFVDGDNAVSTPTVPTAAADIVLTVPQYRVVITSSTTYYLTAALTFSGGTPTLGGRISAVRVA